MSMEKWLQKLSAKAFLEANWASKRFIATQKGSMGLTDVTRTKKGLQRHAWTQKGLIEAQKYLKEFTEA